MDHMPRICPALTPAPVRNASLSNDAGVVQTSAVVLSASILPAFILKTSIKSSKVM